MPYLEHIQIKLKVHVPITPIGYASDREPSHFLATFSWAQLKTLHAKIQLNYISTKAHR